MRHSGRHDLALDDMSLVAWLVQSVSGTVAAFAAGRAAAADSLLSRLRALCPHGAA